ncbi:hypothetical protein LXN77_23870, partial [Escherichia coli]|nr:hypothetical protein [Escherichia coli]
DRNRSHWSTSKTPSYTKSVSWQHHPIPDAPATVDAVETAVPAVAIVPAVPAIVDGLVILIFLLQIEQIQLNYLLNNLTTISLPW